ncbi:hypothetical protein VTN96DRAFT_2603 [Rasamsonia emersonii]
MPSQMTKSDASRIQSSQARGGKDMSSVIRSEGAVCRRPKLECVAIRDCPWSGWSVWISAFCGAVAITA